MLKAPDGSGMIEASITINGVALSFAESMTVRCAIGAFMMYVSSDETAKALGPIADGYRAHLQAVSRILHDPIEAEHEQRRQVRGMPRRKP